MKTSQGKLNKVFNLGVMIAVAAIGFVSPSRSYAQFDCGTSCNLDTASGANQIALTEPVDGTNLAVGVGALVSDIAGGSFNTAAGNLALQSNTTGEFNTATGNSALQFNTTGPHNTADGTTALVFNTTGGDNTAMGYAALASNLVGSGDTAVGFQALNLSKGKSNTALGSQACLHVTTGSNVMCLGAVAGPAANVAGPATYIAGIFGIATTGTGNPLVCIDKTGKLGTTGCAPNGAPSEPQVAAEAKYEELLRTQTQQIADLQQRLSQLELLIVKK